MTKCRNLNFKIYPSVVSSSQMLGTTINAVYTIKPNRIKLIAMIASFGFIYINPIFLRKITNFTSNS